MRRTLALMLALPVALVTLTVWDTGTRTDQAAPSPATVTQITQVPTQQPPTEVDPADAQSDRGRPGADDVVASADAEGTVEESSVEEGGTSAQGPEIAPPPPTGAERTEPVEATFLIASVPEAGAVAGTGRRWRYTIEVESGLGIDPEALATEVRAALYDERSWARSRTLEQVGDPAQARIRVVLASPETVDELCGRVGLSTAGIYSCWNGRFAALNSWRWEVGADGFPDITTYRNYLVNHEFGHGLGYGHVGCPTAGALAPVMMQQSKGLADCVANGWPYP